jgi:hypothetical protein
MTSLKIKFTLFGKEDTASSRLRGFRLVRELNKLGHSAVIEGKDAADIYVFQKSLNFAGLAEAKNNGALVVYDLDDNYLLEGVGTKNDVLRFINFADVVSAGSDLLVDTARRYHQSVYLFENPVDVIDENKHKQNHEWQHRLGWFGNPCNLLALEALKLASHVTTITTNGDIPWALDTIDEELMKLDLVLIPVLVNEWTLSKNANRMLKCIALGVPFLASNTPEHRKMADRLDLPPDDFLVADGEPWQEKIDACIFGYEPRCAAVLEARSKALQMLGIRPVTERWLGSILALARPNERVSITLSDRQRAFLSDLDVVILKEGDMSPLKLTLQRLRIDEINYRSLTVVSALPITGETLLPKIKVIDDGLDFFDIYESLCDALKESQAIYTLVLKAGAQVTHGFFHELLAVARHASLCFFATQTGPPRFSLLPAAPTSMPGLLAEPFIPHALLIESALLQKYAAQSRTFSCLCLWDLLIRASADANFSVCEAPVITVPTSSLNRDPITAYVHFLAHIRPGLGDELPHPEMEWERLEMTLMGEVIETHHQLFARYSSTLIPFLIGRRNAALREAKQIRPKQESEPQPLSSGSR